MMINWEHLNHWAFWNQKWKWLGFHSDYDAISARVDSDEKINNIWSNVWKGLVKYGDLMIIQKMTSRYKWESVRFFVDSCAPCFNFCLQFFFFMKLCVDHTHAVL